MNCKVCGTQFKTKPSRVAQGNGKFCSQKCYFLDKKGRPNPKVRGKLHGQWKGQSVSYIGLHKFLRENKPKPNKCESCGKSARLDIACVTGKYTRNFEDYQWLCRSCHRKFDDTILNIKHMKKKITESDSNGE